ncbi:dihydrolipoamide acetyltransferase family protein [Streptomyces aidingensis]|uniref:Dihydrolipoamide acetyltransferase component of pyruvate dehydrogenase complex n=1 Tax=Streptomyces aidingensis TaxID=910347 RepID=A0A1I1JY59_9ACTN|nr:dihydrolipoamide acetyltransferase family protein [Streptomyces aidingensis]SFC53629.1 pyruvate dehydrogenase E2 component (dihydrolipoamide acetyltransferase) [Streptomyces aidingensis]
MTTASPQRFREFKMPDVGEGLTEAEILTWHVQPGDEVHDGQMVVEVETAKAAVELPIPYDGTVHELLFEEGATVDVGTPIITIDTAPGAPAEAAGPSEAAESSEPAGAAEAQAGGREPVLVGYGVTAAATRRRPRKTPPGAPAAPAAPAGAATPATPATPAAAAVQREMNGAPPPPETAPGTTAAPRPLAKPPVRKLAKDLGVDLGTVIPSGPDGVITRDDVYAVHEAHTAGARPAPEGAAAPAAEEQPVGVEPQSLAAIRERRVPVKGVRKVTAHAMVTSAFTAPHVTEFITVDVTRTMKLVEELRQDPAMAGLRVNPMLLVAKALLVAIRRNPEINASWDEENQEIVYKDYVNLGIAAATPRGLIVPNIKDADAMTLPELSRALGELVATAKEGRTPPAAMQGGTVTISNVGVFGVDSGTPILNPGESAILAFGAVRLQPWVHKGKVKPRHVTTLALSFDHRLVDGELGSKVLADTAAVLEHPRQRLITWA